MKTIRLYDAQPLLTEFDATVISSEKSGNGFLTVLDKTAFFPTGGGQSCDTGSMTSKNGMISEVSDVTEKGRIIYHTTDKEFTVGEIVHCRLDGEARLQKMAAHSGEHIVSALMFSHFGFHNIGFHMGSEDITADFDGVISETELAAIEAEANETVRKNLPISILYPNAEELKSISYRSKLELTENVRLVKIGGLDLCACCAPHMPSTGMIGLILLTELVNYKGGIRVHMLFGSKAVAHIREQSNALSSLTRLLSAKQDKLFNAVDRILEDNKALKNEISALNDSLNFEICKSITKTGRPICIFDERDDVVALRKLASMASEQTGSSVGVFGTSKFVICSVSGGIKEPFASFSRLVQCRGGGSESLICGSFSAEKDAVKKAWDISFLTV